jgi:lipopolysaccharide/colanic/teichoic acid biosynthesis glycosyltransferase
MPREPSSSTILAGVPSAFALDLKRLQDVLVAAFVLLTLAPLLALVALLIKLQDGGPIFYRRRVIGQRGEFDAFKFRSMHVNAEAILKQNPSLRREFERNFKLRSDPRVTKLGAWLRKYSIDELPQLVNVLRGEMSLVGPRMITVPELNKYGESRALLLTVKPGLTGYWQVYGRQDVAYDERVRMDVFYIRNWSLLLDLKLLLLTPVRVLKAAGAH